MAEEEKKETTEIPEDPETLKPVKTEGKSKVLIVGLPLFIIQLIAVYFITANVLLSKMPPTNGSSKVQEQADEPVNKSDIGKFVYSIQDITVNPAGTAGQRYIQVSVAFDLKSEDEKNIFKEREELIKDILNTIFSNKTLDDLTRPEYKDTLKIEIKKTVEKNFKDIKINSVYFSKYIIQ